jgi:hypothetical protein
MKQEQYEDSLLELILFSFFIKYSEQETKTEFQTNMLGTITMTIGEIIDYIHKTHNKRYSDNKISKKEVSEVIKDNPMFFETSEIRTDLDTDLDAVINYKLTDYGNKYVYETLSVY